MTKTKLSDLTGISTRSLSAYEAGSQVPTTLNLAVLADKLRFPTAFFTGPDLAELSLKGASFRALSKMTATQRDMALAAGDFAVFLTEWIDERFELPAVDVPKLRGVDPETAAEAVRGEWGIGILKISNMVHLLESHGVRVFSLVEEAREVDAFSTWHAETPYVFLNTKKSAEHSRFDAAHELGHLVLHSHHEEPQGREAEQEANDFASAFLMPVDSFSDTPRRPTLKQLIKLKHRWGVSLAALVYRMHIVGLLTEWEYRSLFVQLSKEGHRSEEPEPMKAETSLALLKIFKALRDEGITQAEVARQLGIPADELSRLLFGLVLTPVTGDGNATVTPGTVKLTLVTQEPSSTGPAQPS